MTETTAAVIPAPAAPSPPAPERDTRTLGWLYRVITPRRGNLLLALACFAALPPLTAYYMPDLFTPARAGMLTAAAVLVAAALSLNLLMGYAGQISLGQYGILGAGAFTAGGVTGHLGLSLVVAIPAAAAAGAAAALVVGVPALRLRGLYLALATLTFGIAMTASLLRIKGSGRIEIPRVAWGDTLVTDEAAYLAVALVCVLLLFVLDTNVTRSKLGRAFQAIRQDEGVAASFGIGVWGNKLLAFVISGAMAGVAGALLGFEIYTASSIDDFPYEASLFLVIVVIVGGLGSRAAVVTSALAFSLLPHLLDSLGLATQFQGVIGAGVLLFTIARHPGGFAQMAREARERRDAQRARAQRLAAVAARSPDGVVVPLRDGGIEEDDDIEERGAVPPLPDMPAPSALPAERAVVDHSVPVLEVSDVLVRFGGLLAVDASRLVVPRHQIVGLIGPNGAGKTTLFNAISGHIRPERGSVKLNGVEVVDLPPHQRARRGLGRSFQNIGLAKELSVRENLLLAQHLLAGYTVLDALLSTRRAGRVERELGERADQALSGLGFECFRDAPLRTLSHGQQRIVEIACLLATAPELLMLDEPSAGMAPGAMENLAARLRELRDSLGRTVLIIEHSIPLVLDVCDHIVVLNAGQVIAEGAPSAIARDPRVVDAYFGEAVA